MGLFIVVLDLYLLLGYLFRRERVFESEVEGGFSAFLDDFGDERVSGSEDVLIEVDSEVVDFAGSDAFQQMDDLLFHFIVVHDEDMLSTSLDGSSSDHIEADSVSNTDCVSRCDVVLFHVGDDLNDLLCVTDLSVC